MKRILLLSCCKDDAVVTGGHVYNEKFYFLLSKYTDRELAYQEIPLAKRYNGWKRVFAPIGELRWLNKFKKNDVVFFGDTTYKYHMLLLIITKLFCRNVELFIIVHHFPFIGESNDIKGRFRTFSQKMYYRLMDKMIVPSPYTYDVAARLFPKNEIVYVPLPFEQKLMDNNGEDSGRLLYVGTVEPRKGLLYLIESLGILKEKQVKFTLDIVGKIVDDAYYQDLLCLIKKYNLEQNVFFRGRVSFEELDERYANAELFVFPSLLEGYGMVLVEAMQRGLPIVAFDNTAMPYTVKDGINGYLAKNMDYVDLADKIEKVLGNRTLRRVMLDNIKQELRNLKTFDDFDMSIKNLSGSI